jgi:phage tail tape-measure protein
VRIIATFVGVALLCSCGASEPERTQGGAAGGAATGAAIGLLGGPIGVAVGAMVGGGAGALTGAATNPSDLNLGAPPWSDSSPGTTPASETTPKSVE